MEDEEEGKMWLTCGCISGFCAFDMALICVLCLSVAITRPLNAVLFAISRHQHHGMHLKYFLCCCRCWFYHCRMQLLLHISIHITHTHKHKQKHMGKAMMHHSPPRSPNYNLINTFLIFALFHSHIAANITAECAFCVRAWFMYLFVCLFVVTFCMFSVWQTTYYPCYNDIKWWQPVAKET